MQGKRSGQENKRQIGAKYEIVAAEHLSRQGYEILERNYRNSYGEIDLVGKEDETLVFVEVKYRGTKNYGDPLEAVDVRKQRKICKTAFYYYVNHGYEEGVPCRFDVIAIDADEKIRHIKNAFEFRL